MAISVSVVSTTTSTAYISITGMNTYYADKRFEFYLNGSLFDEVTGTTSSSFYYYTYSNLNENTYYTFEVVIQHYIPGLGYALDGSGSGHFTTDSSGSGGGSNPYWTYSHTDSSVTINVYNADDYYVSYYVRDVTNSSTIYDGEISGRVWDKELYLDNLSSNTTYRLMVSIAENRYSGSTIDIYSSSDNLREEFTTGGGGGGGDGGSISGNGQTYIYSDGEWFKATPYIFVWNYNTNSGSWVEATPGIYVNGSWI